MSDPIEVRCADGRACEEVLARVVAGQIAIHVDGDVEQGYRLLAAAARWAAAHGHGSGTSSSGHLEEAG